MAKRRIWGKYERFRLRPGKDEDLYDAIDYQVQTLKKDFADVARDALRAYLGLIPGRPAPITAASLEETATRETMARTGNDEHMRERATREIGDLQLIRKEPTIEELEKKADIILQDE